MKRLLLIVLMMPLLVSLTRYGESEKYYGENGARSTTGHTLTLIAPSNGTLLASDSTRLIWDTDTVDSAFTFDVYCDSLPTPVTLRADGISDTLLDVTALRLGTTYYWRVVAHALTDSLISATWSFSLTQPYSIANTELWLDPDYKFYSDSSYTQCVHGSLVLFAKNRLDTTDFFYQTTAAWRPVFDTTATGAGFIVFNGTSNYLVSNRDSSLAFGASDSLSVWARAEIDTNQGATNSSMLSHYNSSTGIGWALYAGGARSPSKFSLFFITGGWVRLRPSTGNTTALVNYTWTYQPNGTNWNTAAVLWRGLTQQTTDAEVNGGPGTDVNKATSPWLGMVSPSSGYYKGTIHSIAVVHRKLTAGEVSLLNSWGNKR